jgi:hypothetical protein
MVSEAGDRRKVKCESRKAKRRRFMVINIEMSYKSAAKVQKKL